MNPSNSLQTEHDFIQVCVLSWNTFYFTFFVIELEGENETRAWIIDLVDDVKNNKCIESIEFGNKT